MSDNIPKYNLHDDPHKNWRPWLEEIQEMANTLCTEHFPRGLLHLTMLVDEWHAIPDHQIADIYGAVQFVPMPDALVKPILPAHATGLQVRRYDLLNKVYGDVSKGTTTLKKFCLLGIGSDNIDLISQPIVGTRDLTTLDIINALRPIFSAPSEATVNGWKAELQVPHAATDTLRKTLTTHRKIHLRLDDAQQGLSQHEKFTYIEAAFNAYPTYLECIRDYKKENPALSDRTFANLTEYMIQQSPNITTGSIGFTANAALSRTDVQAMITTSIQEAYARGRADGARGSGFAGRGAGRGLPGRIGGRGPGRGVPPGTPRNYCFVHGYDGHTGMTCRLMRDDTTGAYTHAMKAAKVHTTVAGGSVANM
jgi:hypothetical protein